MTSKKVLFLCNTHMQFIFALIIRHTKFEDYYSAVILGSTVGLKKIYDYNYEVLKSYFQEVYWTDNNKWSTYYSQTEYDSNERLIEEFGQDFSDYSDIFFHNRSGALQSILRNNVRNSTKYNLHHYEEGRGIYISGDEYLSRRDIADDTDRNRKINQQHFGGLDYSDLECDIYVCNPDLISNVMKRKTVRIFEETLAEKERNAIISCYSIQEQPFTSLNENVIFLGGANDTAIGHDAGYISVINKIAGLVGYENFLYKAHPRSPISADNSLIKTFVDSLPIEIYELRGELQDKVLITSLSGALCTIKYVFHSAAKVFLLYPMFKKAYPVYDEDVVINYINKLNAFYGGVYLIHSLDELRERLIETSVIDAR